MFCPFTFLFPFFFFPTRWSHSCRKTSDILGFIYFAMVVVLLIMFRQKVKGVVDHLGALLPVLFGEGQKMGGKK